MRNGLAIDIGGTFTDVVLQLFDRVHSTKVLTSHGDPSEAVVEGIARIFKQSKASVQDVEIVLHGTTLATNALIERSGAKTALLTTEGHRDILEMAFENRFEQYDVNIERPAPLVTRKLRVPIRERITASGEVRIPLDHGTVDDAIKFLKQEDVESVAIGFLHSYINGVHERAVADRIRESLGNIPISLSCEVCPEIREYERLSTTCANAYVLLLMSRYLKSLAERLSELGFNCPYLMMTSGGGLTSFKTASKYPIRLVESGPAGGAILAEMIARSKGLDKVISFDMGGTTAKLCLIDEGKTLLSRAFEVDRSYRFKKGSGLPIRIPVIEMVEIGAGGGSIAHIDKLNRIQIGPESAGSQPGPACYGRDGKKPTVTDADCYLGRMDADNFAGGFISLDQQAALQAIDTNIATPLSMSLKDAARGIAEIVDENMSAAARSHAAEWGNSITNRTMIAFGGAAPLHAARLMEKMNLKQVIIPEGAGVGSAIGFLCAPISYEVVRSRHMLLSELDEKIVNSILEDMEEEATSVVATATQNQELTKTASAFMRYVGQGYEITVVFDPSHFNEQSLREHFEQTYTATYGRTIPQATIEIMSWTLNLAVAESSDQALLALGDTQFGDLTEHSQQLTERTEETVARVIPRRLVTAEEPILGPALITESHTSVVVPSGFQITKASDSNALVMKLVSK